MTGPDRPQGPCPACSLDEILSLAGLAAQIILENGAETYRVEDTVTRICHSYGFTDVGVIALSTGVMLSVSVPGDSASIVRRVEKRNLNLGRVNAVNDLSRRIAQGGIAVGDACESMKAIAASAVLPMLASAGLAGLAAGSFALMFGGGLLPFLVALVGGVLSQLVVHRFRRTSLALVMVSVVGGVVCSAVTMLAFYLGGLTSAGVETALAGAIMPLISGLMMTNAVRDTLRGDLLSGLARSVEALIVAILVALGISLLLRFYVPGDSDIVLLYVPWQLAMGYAGIATMFFCPLLAVPGRAVVPASLLGAGAYGAYLLLRDAAGASEVLALFLAAAAIAVLCHFLARHMRMITTIFLCAALVPLVPGLGLYRTMRALLLGEHVRAFAVGLQTLFAVGAIALGAAIGSLGIQRPEASGRRRAMRRVDR